MYVCICKQVSDKKIKQLVEDGAHDMRALRQRCGIGTQCGKCALQARSILLEAVEAHEQRQNREDPDELSMLPHPAF